ncbi:MAG: hypothetical protein KC731_32085, partial [Myxococcales bacterium]|nr:hypothetical protein [Myxococcales bacterium]
YVGPDADSGTNVVSCPKSGCVEAAMLHGSDPQSVVRMTQDDEHLFWIGGRNDARIMRAPK